MDFVIPLSEVGDEPGSADRALAQWLVLDPEGLAIARISLRAGLHVHAAERGRVWGVEMDAPYIMRYGVESSTA